MWNARRRQLMKKMLMFVILTVCMFANNAVFAAFSVNAFEAGLEECVKFHNVLANTDSAGMSGDNARAGLAGAEKKLLVQVMSLSDIRDFSKAKKIAAAWVKRGGTEADAFVKAGNKALKLISDREKALATLPTFNAAAFASLIEDAAKHIDVLENTDTNGMGGDAARAGLDRADKGLRAAVSAISSIRDISRARKVAEVFVKRGGNEAVALTKAGNMALKYVEARKKHITLYKD